jgi:hypothetical protein
LYSLTASQLVRDPVDTLWSTSFITTKCNKQFVIHSNLLVQYESALFRSSILDLTDGLYSSNIEAGNHSSKNKAPGGRLWNTIGHGGFQGLSPDSVSSVRTWGRSDGDNYDYDIEFNASTRVILNAGAGTFDWGSGNTSEWGLPRCKTSGRFAVNGSAYEINPDMSTTWYDRQHGFGGVGKGNFTWFGVQFPGSLVKASIWASDSPEPYAQQLRFATISVNATTEVVPVRFEPRYERSWTSPHTKKTYPLSWVLRFDSGDYLWVESAFDGQETHLGSSGSWSGFASVTGHIYGQSTGFGFIDIV